MLAARGQFTILTSDKRCAGVGPLAFLFEQRVAGKNRSASIGKKSFVQRIVF